MYEELVKRLLSYADLHCPLDRAAGICGCIDAREAAEAILELRKPRWIPVTERLPIGGDDSGAICENVCLLMDDGTVSCGWMNGITKKVYYLNARDDFVIKAPITRVTHWMPLPAPPKEEET